MIVSGNLEKMKSEVSDQIIYHLRIGDHDVRLNDYLDKQICLQFKNQINCVSCGSVTKKSFGQGFCYNCFISAPEASECILHPDKCKAQLGISRDMQWSLNHCLTDHIVYLANSSNIKVGITRKTQIPTRWIDQGATEAIILAITPNRHIAGVIEKYLMNYYSDKTSWQAMLKGINKSQDLTHEKQKAIQKLPNELKQYVIDNNTTTKINYPVLSYPEKVKSISFDKTDRVEGKLTGIKAQYLILDNQYVLNVRKHRGYLIDFEVCI